MLFMFTLFLLLLLVVVVEFVVAIIIIIFAFCFALWFDNRFSIYKKIFITGSYKDFLFPSFYYYLNLNYYIYFLYIF